MDGPKGQGRDVLLCAAEETNTGDCDLQFPPLNMLTFLVVADPPDKLVVVLLGLGFSSGASLCRLRFLRARQSRQTGCPKCGLSLPP